ncbi:MAG: FtsQ-type POTRA domain-containing protein [Peptococcaceae bacterium]|nr:FtsQ-type POTRA domain-containing protein [Peptococcaceae bacterium]
MNKTGKIIVLEEYKSNAEKSVPEQRKQTAPGKQRVRLKKRSLLKGIGAVAGFFVLLYLLGCTPFFQVNSFEVTGNSALTDEKVVALSGIEQGDNFFYADTWGAKRSLRQNPFVENVKIRRKLPDRLLIQVTERRSVGYIVTRDGYVQVGEDGRLLAIQQSLSNYGLPVISGVELSELPAIGGFIQNEKLKQALEVLQHCDQSLLNNIAELNVGQEYYILAYTNQKVEVRLGGLDNIEQRLQDLNQILTTVVGTQIAVDQILYIDMRYEGQPVIKLRT